MGPQLQQAIGEREKDILRDRIDQLLLIQKGKELNINVDSEVSKYMASCSASPTSAIPKSFTITSGSNPA